MDLQEIGAHCSVQSCKELDFLPIKCGCGRVFCRHHISADSHECPNITRTSVPLESTSDEKLQRCAFVSCNKPSLEAYTSTDSTNSSQRLRALCPRCQQSFCAAHRYPEAHACTAEEPSASQQPKNAAAVALLQKHFPGQGSQKPPAPTARPQSAPKTKDPKKLAQLQKVQLMKMRHSAIPGDQRDKTASVPIDQRLHVRVSLDGGGQEKLFWFRKSIGTGKALDSIASHFAMSSSDAKPLRLYKGSLDSDERILLATDRDLAVQVEDGSHLVL
ncbi:hypothetical protein GLOTRDRAFT_57525, partial [Gloeophyllum trabeum ATCC 11539]